MRSVLAKDPKGSDYLGKKENICDFLLTRLAKSGDYQTLYENRNLYEKFDPSPILHQAVELILEKKDKANVPMGLLLLDEIREDYNLPNKLDLKNQLIVLGKAKLS